MGKSRNILLIVLALAIAGGCYFIFRDTTKRYKWWETFQKDGMEPYDAYLVSELLHGYYKGKDFKVMDKALKEEWKDSVRKEHSNYVFIGIEMYHDSASYAKLFDFVKKGNDAFIAASAIPKELLDTLHFVKCEEFYSNSITNYVYDSLMKMNFYHPSLSRAGGYGCSYYVQNEPVPTNWNYFETSYICASSSPWTPLGYILPNKVNFIRASFGKGSFYFHLTPLMFTNYLMLKKETKEYAEKVFSHLQPGAIYWDEYSKIPNYDWGGGESTKAEGPLRFILSQKGLKQAWYFLLGLVLLYSFFHMKRRQRPILLMDENVNTSLEFVQTIGRLYYLQHDHKNLARHKMKLFFNHVRSRYHLSTSKADEVLMQRIAAKSDVPADEVQKIFQKFTWLDRTSQHISDQELIDFHLMLDNFYKKAK